MLVLTCGVAAFGGAPSRASHGGAWGFARVVRVEHSALRMQSMDMYMAMCHSSRLVVHSALALSFVEAEASLRGNAPCVSRLRTCSTAGSVSRMVLLSSRYVITGGLGGLGVRAAVMLFKSGASELFLASRRGRVMRDGQGLERQLRPMSAITQRLSCDSADFHATNALLSAGSPAGVLHAAGAGDRGLLVELKIERTLWMYASKAAGSFYLASAAATVCLLYTSPSPRDS